jgi:hypothetical protein
MMRHLRYAPAVAFALLALGFVGLWVRSYTYSDASEGPIAKWQGGYHVTRGEIILAWGRPDAYTRVTEWKTYSFHVSRDRRPMKPTFLGFAFERHETLAWKYVYVPHWFLAALSFGLAALLAYKPVTRFTVRGLLVATTLLAAMLGLAVYAV